MRTLTSDERSILRQWQHRGAPQLAARAAAILAAAGGRSAAQVAHSLGKRLDRTVALLAAFEQDGLRALLERPRRGRPRKSYLLAEAGSALLTLQAPVTAAALASALQVSRDTVWRRARMMGRTIERVPRRLAWVALSSETPELFGLVGLFLSKQVRIAALIEDPGHRRHYGLGGIAATSGWVVEHQCGPLSLSDAITCWLRGKDTSVSPSALRERFSCWYEEEVAGPDKEKLPFITFLVVGDPCTDLFQHFLREVNPPSAVLRVTPAVGTPAFVLVTTSRAGWSRHLNRHLGLRARAPVEQQAARLLALLGRTLPRQTPLAWYRSEQ